MRAHALAVARIRRAHRLVAGGIWVCAALASGCAAHHSRSHSVAERFIRQGEPAVDLGGPPLSAKPSTAQYVAQLRKLALEARPHDKVTTPEVAEVQDRRLREALDRLRVEPTAEAHRDVAVEYRRLGIADAAYTHLSAAIRLAPKEAASYDLRARIWRSWGLPQIGIPDARRAVALAPRSASAWNTLGLLLENSRRPAEGVKAYLQAVVLEDQAAYAWSNLCRVWVEGQDGASAIHACRRAQALAPADTAVAANLVVAERLFAPARLSQLDSVSADREAGAPQGVTRRSPPVHY